MQICSFLRSATQAPAFFCFPSLLILFRHFSIYDFASAFFPRSTLHDAESLASLLGTTMRPMGGESQDSPLKIGSGYMERELLPRRGRGYRSDSCTRVSSSVTVQFKAFVITRILLNRLLDALFKVVDGRIRSWSSGQPEWDAPLKKMQETRTAAQHFFEEARRGVQKLNYASVPPPAQKVHEVLLDLSKRGQVLVLEEAEARRRYPNLVVASLGTLCQSCSSHLRGQERSPVAGELKRWHARERSLRTYFSA